MIRHLILGAVAALSLCGAAEAAKRSYVDTSLEDAYYEDPALRAYLDSPEGRTVETWDDVPLKLTDLRPLEDLRPIKTDGRGAGAFGSMDRAYRSATGAPAGRGISALKRDLMFATPAERQDMLNGLQDVLNANAGEPIRILDANVTYNQAAGDLRTCGMILYGDRVTFFIISSKADLLTLTAQQAALDRYCAEVPDAVLK